MTAAVLDRRPATATTPVAPVPVEAVTASGTQERTGAQFVRFVLVGGSSNVVHAGVFLSLGGLGTQVAHLVGALASTVLANELHRRLTFRAGGRTGWARAQWAGGGLALAGLAASSLALASLAAWTASAGPAASLLVVGAVNGAVGLVRFAGLRWALTGARFGRWWPTARTAPAHPPLCGR